MNWEGLSFDDVHHDLVVSLTPGCAAYECMALGNRYHAVTVCNDCCAGCAGDGNDELCRELGPCRADERCDGKPCVWRRMEGAADCGVVNNPPKSWFRECEIPY